MEVLHDSRLKNLDNPVECSESVEEGLSDRNMQLKATDSQLERSISPQQQIDEIRPESTIAVFKVSRNVESYKPKLTLDSTLEELILYSDRIESDLPARKAVNIFHDHPLLPGIIITRQGELVGMISRRRFFERMCRPFSWELFSKRPILALYNLFKTDCLVLPSHTSIVVAARRSLERSPDLVYEPIIVKDSQGLYYLLDMHELLLAQSAIHDSAATALRQTEAKYRHIFENAVDGIFQTTPDGRYLSANPALARIYGYDSPEELMESCTDIAGQIYVDPNRRTEFIAAIEENDAVSMFESQVYRQDGSMIWVSENARAVRDSRGTVLYYEGTVEDVTEKKHAEEALRQSEAQLRKQAAELEEAIEELQQTQAQLIQAEKISSLGQLVAGVAHEINNPINCVSSNLPFIYQYAQDLVNLLQLYGKHYPESPQEIKAREAEIDLEFLIEDLPRVLSAMEQGAERIREIARSLRNFSRVDEAGMKPADIHEGIDSTLLILHHRLKAKKGFPEIQVIKEYGNLPPVECYAGQLNQVFMNLIGNAIDAVEEGYGSWAMDRGEEKEERKDFSPPPSPWIRICTEVVNNDWMSIRIIDNGLGMTEEVKECLFKPFFTTKPSGKGTGLGLSISYQIIVEKHHGQLKCHSAPGKGTEFIIEIPICQSILDFRLTKASCTGGL